MGEQFEVLDWARILLNHWKPTYLLEVVIRTVFMFVTVLVILRLAGKRGLKQLSIFELAIIIALGSAAGDPMMYPDSPLLPAIVNFILVIGIYRLITFMAGKWRKAEDILEGKAISMFENGKLNKSNLRIFAYDEFLSEYE